MRSFDEMRGEAWKRTRGGWIWRYVIVWMVLTVISFVVWQLWNSAAGHFGVQTWSSFMDAKAKAVSSGLDFTVPSRAVAMSMTRGSAFEMFIYFILNGIITFGISGLFLRAAKGEDERWLAKSLEGFRMPLGLAWLLFRYTLQVALWSMLFVVPGIVAAYRYCQCWNVKVENPDWSAGKCLAESKRLMKGNKMNRFKFDMSYWKPITALLLAVLAITILVAWGGKNPIALWLMLALLALCLAGALMLTVWMAIGQASFYLELKEQALPHPQ